LPACKRRIVYQASWRRQSRIEPGGRRWDTTIRKHRERRRRRSFERGPNRNPARQSQSSSNESKGWGWELVVNCANQLIGWRVKTCTGAAVDRNDVTPGNSSEPSAGRILHLKLSATPFRARHILCLKDRPAAQKGILKRPDDRALDQVAVGRIEASRPKAETIALGKETSLPQRRSHFELVRALVLKARIGDKIGKACVQSETLVQLREHRRAERLTEIRIDQHPRRGSKRQRHPGGESIQRSWRLRPIVDVNNCSEVIPTEAGCQCPTLAELDPIQCEKTVIGLMAVWNHRIGCSRLTAN